MNAAGARAFKMKGMVSSMKAPELGKENLTDEFTIYELIQQAILDDSWEEDPQKRALYAENFFYYIKSFL